MKRLLALAVGFVAIALACRMPTEYIHDTTIVTDTLKVTKLDTFIVKLPGRVDTVIAVHFHVDTVVKNHFDTTFVTLPPKTDTVVKVHYDTTYIKLPAKTDTVVKIRIDTLVIPPITHYDTTYIQLPGRVDTVVVIKHDTTTIQLPGRVDTVIKIRVDTIYQVVTPPPIHDTTFVYVQTHPSNPLGGGDPNAGLAVLHIYEGYSMVFWHGNFVGVIRVNNSGYYDAYLYNSGSGVMPWRGYYNTEYEASVALIPIVIALHSKIPMVTANATLLK